MINQNMDFESTWCEIQIVLDKSMDILIDVYSDKVPSI